MRTIRAMLLNFSMLTLLVSCDPDGSTSTDDRPNRTDKENYFKGLNRLFFENQRSYLFQFEQDYYVLSNATDPHETDIVFFADQSDSADTMLDFYRFGMNYLGDSDVVLLPYSEDRMQQKMAAYGDANRYLLANVYMRDKIYRFIDDFLTFDQPKDVIKVFSLRDEIRLLKTLEFYGQELSWQKTPWDDAKVHGWEDAALIDDDPLKNQSLRVTKMAKVVSDHVTTRKRVLVQASAYYLPHYAIAYAKTLLLKEEPSKTIQEMIAAKGVDKFFALCKSLAPKIRARSSCDASASIWQMLQQRDLKYALLVKKQPKKTYEKIFGVDEVANVIRDKGLVPSIK